MVSATETEKPVWTWTENRRSVEISRRSADIAERGVLWIFSNELRTKPSELKVGEWCHFTSGGRTVGVGYVNPHSLIAGRIVSLKPVADVKGLLESRLKEAFLRRQPLDLSESTRLVFSEADFIPGLILDYFSGVLILQSNTAGIDAALPVLESLVPTVFEKVFHQKPESFIVRADSGIRRLESVGDFIRVVEGDESALKEGSFSSGGVLYAADFLEGQKTGFFLDQVDNRIHLIEELKRRSSARVLDLFCYSGGWGLSALKAGASQVTFIDESKDALRLVEKGLDLNRFPASSARLVASDAFEFLEKDSAPYDIIVSDPPAFVKSKKNLPQALKAYEKLNRLAWRRLKPGGILYACSCSYHLAESDLLTLLQSAVAREKSFAHVVYRGSQSADHPVLLSMPETRYLKCIGLRKIPA